MQLMIDSDHTGSINDVQNWIEFNQLPYHRCQLWDEQDQIYCLPGDIENSIIICGTEFLSNLLAVPSRMHQRMTAFEDFFRNHNRLWIIGTDLAVNLMLSSIKQLVERLDTMIPRFALTFFLDAEPTDRCYLQKLQNIRLKILTTNLFNRVVPRCQALTTDKSAASHDFLLTMIRKRGRPHRDVLWTELCQRPGLKDRGLISARKNTASNSWQGRTSHQHDWQDGHASMDLYLDCWLEIVPETCYRDLYYFTEKTQKPIMTRTPFLTVSTAGYLEWLGQQGFHTFHSLIDEGYDRHYRVEDRVRGMVDVLEHIVDNGAEEFYRASQPILDHNFSRLCEIAGAWWCRFDQTLWRAFADGTKN
jgi:hypothetical protein